MLKKLEKLTLILCLISLTGCLPAAVFTAASSATFASSKDQSIGDTVDDVAISTKIKKEFLKQGFKSLYTKIDIEVVQRRVMLTGEVESDSDVIKAVDICWSVGNVKEVINELKISENSNKFDTAQYAKDSWITSRIKTSTFFNRSIKFVNYTILTSNNIVYLFGIARTQEELEQVSKIAAEVPGVERVVSYVHLKEEAAPKIDDHLTNNIDENPNKAVETSDLSNNSKDDN